MTLQHVVISNRQVRNLPAKLIPGARITRIFDAATDKLL